MTLTLLIVSSGRKESKSAHPAAYLRMGIVGSPSSRTLSKLRLSVEDEWDGDGGVHFDWVASNQSRHVKHHRRTASIAAWAKSGSPLTTAS